MYNWDVLPWYTLLNDDIVLFEKSGAGINFKLGDSKVLNQVGIGFYTKSFWLNRLNFSYYYISLLYDQLIYDECRLESSVYQELRYSGTET